MNIKFSVEVRYVAGCFKAIIFSQNIFGSQITSSQKLLAYTPVVSWAIAYTPLLTFVPSEFLLYRLIICDIF